MFLSLKKACSCCIMDQQMQPKMRQPTKFSTLKTIATYKFGCVRYQAPMVIETSMANLQYLIKLFCCSICWNIFRVSSFYALIYTCCFLKLKNNRNVLYTFILKKMVFIAMNTVYKYDLLSWIVVKMSLIAMMGLQTIW